MPYGGGVCHIYNDQPVETSLYCVHFYAESEAAVVLIFEPLPFGFTSQSPTSLGQIPARTMGQSAAQFHGSERASLR